MKSNLVTTYLPETFSADSKNILLGEWCRPYGLNSKLFSNSKYIKYHWDDFTKIEKDYEYLYEVYYKSIKQISKKLNEFHKLDKPTKFWQIIVGPWLANQLSMFWDRWENIRIVFENEKIDFTKCLKYSDVDLIPSDYKESVFLINNHNWNHFLFSEIINFGFKKNLKIEKIENQTYGKLKVYETNIHQEKINPLKLYIDKFFSKFHKNRKVMFYESYFGFFPSLLLSLKLGDYPREFFEFMKKITLPGPINRNHLEIDIIVKNNFESFYKKNIFKYMPITYLEGFKLLQEKSNLIKSEQEIIFTAAGHVSNDLFKIWVANKVINGKKFIISDHGGYWEESVFFDSWRKTCDYFLTWNLTKEKNCLQVPCNILFGKKKKFLKKDNGKHILLVANSTHTYVHRITTAPNTGQILYDYKIWKIFINKLESNIKDNLILRPHPYPHDDWKMELRFSDDFGASRISEKRLLKKDILRSKIIINTTTQTTLYESMKSGVPTLLINDRKILKINPFIQELLDEFKENNIMFSDPVKAAQHVRNIWSEPLEWWNSDKIIKLREKFSLICSKEVKNDLLFWKNFFNSQLIKK